MVIVKLHRIVGFYSSISILSAYTGNTILNVGMTLAFFGIIFFITTSINIPLVKQKFTKSKLSFFYFLYVSIAILSIIYFFDGDLVSWFVGVLPFIFTIYFCQNSIPREYTFLKKKELIKVFWAGAAFGSIIVLILSLIFGQVINSRLSTEILSANTIARYTIVVIGYHASNLLLPKNKKLDILILAFAFFILFMTVSKTSIIAVLLTGLYLLISLRLVKFKVLFPIALTTLLFMLTPIFTSTTDYLKDYLEADQLETLSGRQYIWIPLVELVKENIWLGYGYNSPKNLLTPKYFDVWNGRSIIQAHNAWLQSLLNIGTIGTVVLFLLVIFQFKTLNKLKHQDKDLYFLLFFVFATLIIRGFTEASFANGGGVDVFWFSFIILQSLFIIESKKYFKY